MRCATTTRPLVLPGRFFLVATVLAVALTAAPASADAQGRDALLNGALIGAAAGAGAGIAFTHAVRDSDLVFSQYARGALIFGAIGAGIGLGVDALLDRQPRAPARPPRGLVVTPVTRLNVAGIVLKWRW